jgi:acetyl esterase/lipase
MMKLSTSTALLWDKAVHVLYGIALALAACSPESDPTAPQANVMGPSEFQALPFLPPDRQLTYGEEPTQIGELRVPVGTGPFPVVVLIHGGCWREPFASLRDLGPIGDQLKAEDIASWNVEYRRLPQAGSGWPGTYLDIAKGVDHLRSLAAEYNLDLDRVVIVGHSAGGHLAMWAASRGRIGPQSAVYTPNPLRPLGVINLAGTMDMSVNIENMEEVCQAPVVRNMMGGSPVDVPDNYRDASAFQLLPLGVRQVVILGEHEEFIPRALAEAHVDAAQKAGDEAQLIIVPGAGHFEIAAPSTSAWSSLHTAILALLGGELPPPK